MVQLRKDLDIDIFMKHLKTKADGEQVNADLKNHEFKISILDQNLIHIANDFSLVQNAIKTIHTQIQDLVEVNKDVLLGKRKLDCLSCGVESDTNNSRFPSPMFSPTNV